MTTYFTTEMLQAAAAVNHARRQPENMLTLASSRPSDLWPTQERKLTYWDELAEELGLDLGSSADDDGDIY